MHNEGIVLSKQLNLPAIQQEQHKSNAISPTTAKTILEPLDKKARDKLRKREQAKRRKEIENEIIHQAEVRQQIADRSMLWHLEQNAEEGNDRKRSYMN